MSDLKIKIEKLREKLCCLLFNKELIDAEVVSCSQQLDKLLVQYEKENEVTAQN